jgi:LmbE family N-acetylglucosaminyl deacetylase
VRLSRKGPLDPDLKERLDTPPADVSAIKRKHRKRRIVVYGTLFVAAWAFWAWVPWNFDIVERKPKKPLPRVDPDVKKLFTKGTRILLVTAHPDDSEFYIGGALTRLGKSAEIHQVICTDGDKTYYWIFTNAAENRRVRRIEAKEALGKWGGKTLDFLGYPDGRLRVSDELVDKIVDKIRIYRPDYVFAFDPDYPPRVSHSDHRRAGEAAQAAVLKAGVPLWHMMFSTNAPNFFIDISDQWPDKEKLLQIHRSQFHGDRLEKVTNMVAYSAEKDGEALGTTYAEGFRCVRIEK